MAEEAVVEPQEVEGKKRVTVLDVAIIDVELVIMGRGREGGGEENGRKS